MSDEDALLAAVLANPDDDMPRLVYADWVQENGQPEFAEFIRLQCQREPDAAAQRRTSELETRHRSEWLELFPSAPRLVWEFRRGFPEVLRMPGATFLECIGSFSSVRWIRSLCLWDMWNQTVIDFANQTWNRRWIELDLQEHPEAQALNDYNTTPALRAIAGCAFMCRIRRLRLARFVLAPDGITALAASPHLGALEQLTLNGDPSSPLLNPLRARFGDRLVVEQR